MTTPSSLSLSNLIGLSDQVYKNMPKNLNDTLTINGSQYVAVLQPVDDGSTSYQGVVLLDVTTHSLIIVNRGTQELEDWKIDAEMADKDVNLQWSDALNLAQQAADYAAANGISTIYAVGHSLGGTLAQMQAAYFGWKGVTFNAYGADELYKAMPGYTISPSADITNYRTMYDLVSDASEQIGAVKTLETPSDQKLFASGISHHPLDFISKFYSDHLISNFYETGTDIDGTDPKDPSDHIYTAVPAFDFLPSPRTVAIAQDQVAAVVATLEVATAYKSVTDWRFVPFFPHNFQDVQNSAKDVWELMTGQTLTGMSADIPSDPMLLQNALNPDPANNIYRAALVAGSPVVLQGADPAQVASDTLWAPGQSSGLTKEYLIARDGLVQTRVTLEGEGYYAGGTVSTDSQNSYIYTDFSESPDTVYKLVGTGPDTYSIEFGTDGNDVLSPTAGTLSEVFGGAGDDTLVVGSGVSTLEGGAGNDQYWIDGTQTGTDHILDTDGQGNINWELPDGSSPILTGGDAVPGGSMWKSVDGSITYTELAQADGTTELEIHSGNKTVYVDDFTNGELGITLNAATPPTYGSSNLSLLRDGGVVGNTDIPDGADHIYTNDADTGPVATIYGADSSGTYGNEINGEGNATYIYAGNGDNTVLLGDFSYKATAPLATPINSVLQGGSGNQSLIGVGNGAETITGGAVGSDTSASTYIDGGGATAMLVGGGQTSVIFGGTGADTLVASSADGSSPPGFNPTSIEIAGLSFWGDVYSTQLDENNNSYQETALPAVNWVGTSSDDVQINLSLFQSDGTFAAPIGLLGSSMDSGTDDGATTLPGSLLIGGTGNDWLIGNAGNDTIIGGDPTDTVSGVVDEVLVGGAGANLIYGGGGTEVIYADMVPDAVSDWAGLNPADADTIYGGTGDEFIYGSGGNDVIYGGSGDYTINTGNGNAYVEAGSGNTLINGGTGNDTIIAGGGTDSITTGDGNSYVNVAGGQALITTGAGSDTIEAAGGDAFITEGSGTTTILAGPGTGTDVVEAGSSSTTVQLQGGLTESALIARDVDVNGDLELSDEDSDTQIWVAGYFTGGSGSVAVQFEDGTTWGASQILAASMAPRTDGGNDTLIGSDGNDSITAGYGDTAIVGVSGNNTLTGGAGDDTIQGGSGADTIEGGSGTTQILGGTGSETYVYNLGDGSDTIFENATVAGVDALQFGAGISPSDVTYSYDSTSNSLLIQFGTLSGATINVQDFLATQPNQHQIATFAFADGTTLTQLQVFQKAVTINGTSGNDILQGTTGADYFDGMGGNDVERGEGGNDTFVFNAGYGQLSIGESYTSGQQPVLQLGAGITASALHASTNAIDLTLTDAISGDQITLGSMWLTSGDGVAVVQLADGTTLTTSQLIQMEMTGTTGSDTIWGTSGADSIDGKGGNDRYMGKGGSDTFVYDAGYGHLEITENYGSGQQPVLQLGDGITASALQVASDGIDLILTDGVGGDEIDIDNAFAYSSIGYGVAELQLDDGTTYSATQLIQMEMTGTTGADTIYGTSGADLIDGKGGNDYEFGQEGSDTFVYNAGYGQVTINENYTSGQQPVLRLGAGITSSALNVTSDGDGLILTDGVSGDLITLYGMLWPDNGVAAVQLADGTSLTASQLLQMEMTGTTGADAIYGTPGADLIDGKGGNDFEDGQGGSDTFIYNAGYGQLEIAESYANGEQPVLQLGAGITVSALSVRTDAAGDLMLTDGVSGDEVILDNMENEDPYDSNDTDGIAAVQLSDGTSLTRAQLLQMEMTGTTGDDTLYGTPDDDVIDGKGGSKASNGNTFTAGVGDYEVGNGGNDTFVFNTGYGQLMINEDNDPSDQFEAPGSFPSGKLPVLQLGSGITAAALHVWMSGNDLYLTDGVSGDMICLEEMANYGDYGVAKVQLADGTTLSATQLFQMAWTGTPGDDSISGNQDADLIDGKGGNDVENGNGGSDTFVFDAGYGQLTIHELYFSGQQPVLKLGDGITTSMLRVKKSGNDLVLSDGITGDQITLYDMWSNSAYGVATVQLADGTVLTRDQLIQMEMVGTAGNDTIFGTSSAELLDGLGGDDSVIGDGGSDTFIFNTGYGQLDINESYNTGQTPILQLGAGITASALRVAASGSDMVLTDGTSGDQITLNGMFDGFTGGNEGVAEVQLADGTILTKDQLAQMELASATTGNDSLYGSSGADLIDGKGGSDFENGESGSDTFVFEAGYGQLTINNGYASGDQTVLKLGGGITTSALKVLVNGSDVEITDGIPGDKIILQNAVDVGFQDINGYVGSAIISPQNLRGVTEITLDDGTILTADQLAQMAGNTIYGIPGSDTIGASYSTPNGDYIDGWGGNDLEFTSGGNDTFVFNPGYGQLTVTGAGARDWPAYTDPMPVLELGAGITASDLIATADPYNLYLTDGVTGDKITLWDMGTRFNGTGSPVVQLADGTTLTMAQLLWASSPSATTGSDELVGTWGAELIDGKGGNDYAEGGGGSDTFVFDAGYGDLKIDESYTNDQQPVLQLGTGIAASAIQVLASGNDLILTDGVSGDQITLIGENSSDSAGVALAQLADGTTLTAAQLVQMSSSSDHIDGTTGSDTLIGTQGADLIDGKGGSDSATGNGGSDTFVFNSGYGDLEINESYASGQQPVLQLGTGITSSALRVSAEGNDLVLTDGIAGDQVTLLNMATSGTSGVASVALADGTTLTAAQLIQMSRAIYGTTGNDTLTGTSDAELIDGEGGNDSITGSGGDDTFVFGSGYGQLTINESYTSGQQPVLELGAGITASTLRVTTSGSDLELTDGVSGDQISLYDMWSSSSHGVATVQLADGTVLTRSQLIQMEMAGTTGNDTIYGTSGADLLDGKGGDDSIVGSGGNDTFVFDSGYGQLTVNESYTSSQQPELELGTGITTSNLRVTRSSSDLVLTDGVSGDQITLYDMWSSTSHGIAAAQFADGTVLTRSQLFAMEMIGTPGDDTLYGSSGDNLMDGKGGKDSLIGSGGNDTFVFDTGYGALTINEHYSSGQQPVLELGDGITTSTLSVKKSGSNLVLTDGVSGDQVTLYDMWSYSTYGVATVQLADGTVLTRDQLIQMEMAGTTGNDTIYGTSGADLIDGKGGSDSVIGSGGNDTFVFDSGYGALVINESFASGQQPVLQLGAGITASTLRVTSNGVNLYLSDGVSGDKITLDNMWTSDLKGVATVQLADGTTFTRSQLIPMEMTGTTGNNTIYGTAGADLIDGKGGNDLVKGEGGNDTIVFDEDYGYLTVSGSFTSGQEPVLQLGEGITASTLRVTSNGVHLFLTDGISGDKVTLYDMWTSDVQAVAAVQLADGTTFTRSQLIQMEMTGTTSYNTIYGTSDADLMDGKGGNDTLIGDGGNDTFVYDPGYGHLTINESFTSGQTPVLNLGSGITASTLAVATSGSDLLLTDDVSGDQITLDGMATSSTSGVATVQFADGTTLTRSQLLAMEPAAAMMMASPAASDVNGADDITSMDGLAADSVQDVTLGAGSIRFPTTMMSTTSSAGGRLEDAPQQNHSASHIDAHAGQSPTSRARTVHQPGTPAGVQPPLGGNGIDQHGQTLPPISPLDTHLGRSSLVPVQPGSEADPSQDAPVDPLMSDPDDPTTGYGFSLAGEGSEEGGMQQPVGTPARSGIFSPAFGQRQIVGATNAAKSMIKTLAARDGSFQTGSDFGSEPQDEIRLQGGEVWTRSAVDRALSGLPSAGSGVSDLSSRLTDLAHAQLISAMASFSPRASSESISMIPPSLDTYTIAAAIGMH